MLYPFQFIPVYKDYIWGGRNLERLGKELPEGKVAESWELSCHPDGMSVVKNGTLRGRTLQGLIDEYGSKITGDYRTKTFPLLVKLIDAADKLSVQVHPDDNFALAHEGEFGKNEFWYVLDAKPDAYLIYDFKPSITRSDFEKAVCEDRVGDCLQIVPVRAGDFLNIPAGLIHSIGEGILLAEIQQSSNTTYRIFDYNRTDAKGTKRPLHLEKAMEVIRFNKVPRKVRYDGLIYESGVNGSVTILVANRYYCVELLRVSGEIEQNTAERQFHILLFIEGDGEVLWSEGKLCFHKGDTMLIPAVLSNYRMSGRFTALKSFVPDLNRDIFSRLQSMGFSIEEILTRISGLAV